ncbi:MAG: S66 peptidase family protein [Ferruginibacter sp.]
MKRQQFLQSLLSISALGSASTMLGNTLLTSDTDLTPDISTKIPPYLKKGDTIGICSPAGYISEEDIIPAITLLKEWGFEVKNGSSIGKKDFTFGGTDVERKNDFQQMLNDRSIKAILCARGGYGVVRIIDELNFNLFKKYPKWIIGFSDITVLHNHLSKQTGIASIHSKMCNSFPENWTTADPIQIETINSIKACLTGTKMRYEAAPNLNNRFGKTSGILIGGNLKTIETLAGTKSDIDTRNKILFVEDTGEYLYSIDRMFWNLKRTGKLNHLAGLIVGGFKIKPDENGEGFGKTLEDIVMEKVAKFKYPVCFNFPVGHQKNNMALKCGAIHHLDISAEKTILFEK